MNDQGSPIKKDTGDFVWMGFELLSRKYTVKYKTWIRQRASLECKGSYATSVGSVGSSKLRVEDVVIRTISLSIDVFVAHIAKSLNLAFERGSDGELTRAEDAAVNSRAHQGTSLSDRLDSWISEGDR